MSLKNNDMVQTYLTFKLGEESFAVNVVKVINILELRHITKVPKAPVYMKGVINLRGSVLPVVDLRTKFGLQEKEITIDTSIIVLTIEIEGEPILIGAQVDEVQEVLEIQSENIAPSPSLGTKYNSGFISGMWRIEENFIMILDIDKVFSSDEIIDLKEQMASQPTIVN